MNKRALGGRFEELAADHLIKAGLVILERNYRCRIGEIDLIARDEAGTIVFAEVKYRKSTSFGQPYEAVDLRKRKTICRVADHYRLCHGGLKGHDFRFDVISILGEELTWFQNAFPYML